jgi:CheY-like chemotaxis protein
MVDEENAITILYADDDADDCAFLQEALAANGFTNELRCVEDGEELMDYLHRRGRFAEPGAAPRPNLILLDLNMPRKDGREALEQIKSDPTLRRIPTVVLSTSRAQEDIFRTYDLGGNSFITKPDTFESMVSMVRSLGKYWLTIVELPNGISRN